ncbi:MAG: alpha/beta fold hydrolase [Alphaproteobacteria bacterium]|nr:alpha/beta fold hydrolase [Alphaproteobacteria bacterium]
MPPAGAPASGKNSWLTGFRFVRQRSRSKTGRMAHPVTEHETAFGLVGGELSMTRRLSLGFLVLGLAAVYAAGFTGFAGSIAAADVAKQIGVVLMHGKGGTNRPLSPVGKLKADLESAGYAVVTPELPWSRERQYADTIEAAFEEIDQAVRGLRDQGAQKIVIAGHSLGANMAIAYGTQRSEVTGIIAIAPGHIPDSKKWRKLFADNVAKAKEMIVDGRGAAYAEFTDRNQGRASTINVRANVYISYFDPAGLAAMRKTVSHIKPDTSVLWIIEESKKDKFAGRKTFNKIAKGAKRHYAVVDSTHRDAPEESASTIISWLKNL